MMSYTIPCTSLCSSGGTLMRRTSPCTLIMGGRPADRCKSEALFLTEKARSSAISIWVLFPEGRGRPPGSGGRRVESPRKVDSIMSPFAVNLQAIRRRISEALQGDRRDISLVAVTKSQPPEAVRAAFAAGLRDFGESYVQEALPKVAALADLVA